MEYRTDNGLAMPVTLDEYKPSLWQSLKFSFGQAWEYNTGVIYKRMAEAQGNFDNAFANSISDADVLQDVEAGNYQRPVMPVEKQRERIEEAGLKGFLEPQECYTEQGLAIAIEGKKYERACGLLGEKAPGWHTPFSFAAGLAAGALDPANIVMAVMPLVPEQRMMELMGLNAKYALQRAAARAASGGVTGAAFGALYEPMMLTSDEMLQRDFGFANSLMRISTSAILGAALAPAAGQVADFTRARRGEMQPWSFARETADSRSQQTRIAERLTESRMGANPGQDLAEVTERARADAAQLDLYARHMAFERELPVERIYDDLNLIVENGERHNQEAARLLGEIEGARQELEFVRGQRAQTEELGLREVADPMREGELTQRLDNLEGNLATARREALRMREEMWGGDTLYQEAEGKVLPVDPEGNARIPWDDPGTRKPDLEKMRLFEKLEPLKIDTGYLARENPRLLEDTKLLRDRMLAYAKAGMDRSPVINEHDGTRLLFPFKGIKSTLYHGTSMIKNATVPHLKELAKTAVPLGEFSKPNGATAKYYASRVVIDGTEYVAIMVAKRNTKGMYLYDHEMSQMIKPSDLILPNQSAEKLKQVCHQNRGLVFDIARELLGVKSGIAKSLFQTDPITGAIRGATTFIPDGPTILRIFQAHDQTTCTHEIGHVVRRMYQSHAERAGADSALGREYARLERHYGVGRGMEWSRGLEERFAEDFVNHVFRGKAANPALANSYAVMKDCLLEVYQSADSAGVQMRQEIRDAFNELISVPPHEGQRQFENTMADLLTRNWEELFVEPQTAGPVLHLDDTHMVIGTEGKPREVHFDTSLERLNLLNEMAEAKVDGLIEDMKSWDPEGAARLREEADATRKAYAEEFKRIEEEGKLFEELVMCYFRAGA